MRKESLSDILTTFITNGFHIEKVERFTHENSFVYTYKYDKLGAIIKYSILFTEDATETSITDTLAIQAKKINSTAIVVSDKFVSDKCKTYTSKKFFDFFGGVINTGLIMIPKLPDVLNELGHNNLPNGLFGSPDDLHEIYVSECMQFILESPSRRYGKDRLFEKLPDTVILGKERFMILLDSKAYSDGFSFKADDIKRFAYYVNDFRQRYASFFGDVYSFLVVSGHFNESDETIRNRSRELYIECNCNLSTITSKELGMITELLKINRETRSAINWKSILSSNIISLSIVEKEIQRVEKDKMF